MRRFIPAVLFVFVCTAPAWGAIKGEPVDYKAGDTTLKGYLAYDDALKGKRPGVLVVHEWWGHNEHARDVARKLAETGYVALAVDMYGDGKQANHPQDAGKLAAEVRDNLPVMTQRFDAAHAALARHPLVDAQRIAAVGYCFGGNVVLNMARIGADLRGVASLHGPLAGAEPAQRGRVKAKVLVLNGANDVMVDKASIDAFEKEMKDAGVDYKIVHYPGAKHAFTNPNATKLGKQFNMPIAYHAEADKKSWVELTAFLQKLFKDK
jgi:dienelactone hydrolase